MRRLDVYSNGIYVGRLSETSFGRADFENFAALVGLNPVRYNGVLDLFREIPTSGSEMVSASVLPDKYKRIYMRTLSERTARFNRKNV